jgi:hypothetical protein
MPKKLYSYIVDHDHGYAPNPYNNICTLVHCKFAGTSGRRNIVELVNVGDWVLGSGGCSHQSSGSGTILYLMRVDEKLTFNNFLSDHRFNNRLDHHDSNEGNQFALVSHHYFYFGRNAVPLNTLPMRFSTYKLLKKGPGFRCDLQKARIEDLVKWFEQHYEIGMHGDPCTSIKNHTKIKMRESASCKQRRCLNRNAIKRKRVRIRTLAINLCLRK